MNLSCQVSRAPWVAICSLSLVLQLLFGLENHLSFENSFFLYEIQWTSVDRKQIKTDTTNIN